MDEVENLDQNLPKKLSFVDKIIELFKSSVLLSLILLVVVISLALFLAYFAVRYVWLFIAAIISAIFYGIYNGIMFVIAKIVYFITVIAIIVGSGYAFWHYNPDFRYKVERTISKTSHFSRELRDLSRYAFSSLRNISLPEIPSLKSIFGGGSSTLIDALKSDAYSHLGGINSIPEEIYPMLSVVQDKKDLEKYLSLVTSGRLGANGQGAIPILSDALKSNRVELRLAAEKSLKSIGTPDARRVLLEFRNQVDNTLKKAK